MLCAFENYNGMSIVTGINETTIAALFEKPVLDLLFEAQSIHRRYFKPNEVERCTLLSIKTGACPEDCKYCPQSGHYQTGLQKEKLMDKASILAHAQQAKAQGATRFCMGAAWRNPPEKSFDILLDIIREVKALGLETCMTLGMLSAGQAQALKVAGLDFYNHNLDTSADYYREIISTRTYADRLQTLQHLREQDLKVCCGGIIGMGETREDRVKLLSTLANLPRHPESVPINRLIPIPGTPLANAPQIDDFEFIRTVAVARIAMPRAMIRLSAGREQMSETMQTLCFMAGANSIFLGERLLTANNPSIDADELMFKKLGLTEKLSSHAQ